MRPVRTVPKRLLQALAGVSTLCAALVGPGCKWRDSGRQTALPTVAGPEATDLVARLGDGYLVPQKPRGEIVAVSLPFSARRPRPDADPTSDE